ncbi:MAG TPA: hypothetical protein VFG39_05555, partial [Balneolaceae bacterium]|nr:hypothetical protein [Balneolaceae bacterium]
MLYFKAKTLCLFLQCSHEKPMKGLKFLKEVLFMAVRPLAEHLRKSALLPWGIPMGLLVRFLWANKKNEQ